MDNQGGSLGVNIFSLLGMKLEAMFIIVSSKKLTWSSGDRDLKSKEESQSNCVADSFIPVSFAFTMPPSPTL